MHIRNNHAFFLTYHGYLSLNMKTTCTTRGFVIWHTVEYSSCILQHNCLLECLGNKGFCDHIMLRNSTHYILFYRFVVHISILKVKRKSTIKIKQNKNTFSLFEVNISQTILTRENL